MRTHLKNHSKKYTALFVIIFLVATFLIFFPKTVREVENGITDWVIEECEVNREIDNAIIDKICGRIKPKGDILEGNKIVINLPTEDYRSEELKGNSKGKKRGWGKNKNNEKNSRGQEFDKRKNNEKNNPRQENRRKPNENTDGSKRKHNAKEDQVGMSYNLVSLNAGDNDLHIPTRTPDEWESFLCATTKESNRNADYSQIWEGYGDTTEEWNEKNTKKAEFVVEKAKKEKFVVKNKQIKGSDADKNTLLKSSELAEFYDGTNEWKTATGDKIARFGNTAGGFYWVDDEGRCPSGYKGSILLDNPIYKGSYNDNGHYAINNLQFTCHETSHDFRQLFPFPEAEFVVKNKQIKGSDADKNTLLKSSELAEFYDGTNEWKTATGDKIARFPEYKAGGFYWVDDEGRCPSGYKGSVILDSPTYKGYTEVNGHYAINNLQFTCHETDISFRQLFPFPEAEFVVSSEEIAISDDEGIDCKITLSSGKIHTITYNDDLQVKICSETEEYDEEEGKCTVDSCNNGYHKENEEKFDTVDAGYLHTCAINTNGALKCWGRNMEGQTNVPSEFTTGTKAVDAGNYHTCAINSNGALKCWGYNGAGEINVPDGFGSGTKAVVTGRAHTCAINSSGALKCWGSDRHGQINVPDGFGSGTKAVSAEDSNTCAINSNGALKCWGYDGNGRINVPSEFTTGTKAVYAGGMNTCVINSSGALKCWGYNVQGQINVPDGFGSGTKAVSAEGHHTCAINSNGALKCWGYNGNGRINVPDGFGSGTKAVATGGSHTCAINSNGALKCWGQNEYGQTTVPFPNKNGDSCVSDTKSCTIPNGTGTQTWSDGAWGNCTVDSCDNGYTENENGDSCVSDTKSCTIPNGTGIQTWSDGAGICTVDSCDNGYHEEKEEKSDTVSAGSRHTCAINSSGALSGALKCWGKNSSGQINVPDGFGSGTKAVATGSDHTCAINSNGALKCWGSDEWGQINVPDGFGSGTKAVATEFQNTCAINSNGALKCWGYIVNGRINVPDGFGSGTKAVDAGDEHTCAINSNGALKCWGENEHGQINVPDGFGSGTKAVSAGSIHTCAINSNGTLKCWGHDGQGQINVPDGFGSGTKAVATGGRHTCAINTNGALKCWGYNSYGQINVPDGFGSGTKAVATGFQYTCAINSNGSLKCWGNNSSGQTTVPFQNKNRCVSDTKSCTIPNGTGIQTWNGSTWGKCTVDSCNNWYTENENGDSCVPKPRSRTVARICSDTAPNYATRNSPSGTTTQTTTWNTSTGTWNNWTGNIGHTCGFSCNSGYTKSGNSCVPTNNITSCTSNSSCSANTTKKTCSGYVSARSAIPASCDGGASYQIPRLAECLGLWGNRSCSYSTTEINDACVYCDEGYTVSSRGYKTNYSLENNCNNLYYKEHIICYKDCSRFTYSQCPSDCTKRQKTAAISAQDGTCVELHGAM